MLTKRTAKIRNGYRELRWDDEAVRESPIDSERIRKRAYKWIAEHRVVASVGLRRDLKPDEVVHHIDGNKLNNSPENLVVLKRDEHSREHKAIFRELLSLREQVRALTELMKLFQRPDQQPVYL